MFKRMVLICIVLFFAVTSVSYAVSKVDINSAGVESLMTLKGVGEKYAKRIIIYREKNGPFKKIEDLTNVKGIGRKTVKLNKDIITIKTNKKE